MTLTDSQLSAWLPLGLFWLLTGLTAAAQEPEIFRCPQADGTVAFQGTPCPAPASDDEDEAEPAADANDASPTGQEAFVNPFDLPVETDVTGASADVPELPSDERQACETETRAAIDAIDAELAASGGEDAKSRLDELLELTRQLRACKSL